MHEVDHTRPPRHRCPSTRSPSFRHAFTLIELLVVVSIITLLIAMVVPSMAQSRQRSRRVACASNLHQIGLAIHMYTMDYGYFPGDHLHREPNSIVTWPPRLMRFLGNQQETFWCPSAPPDTRWNGHARIVSFVYLAAPGEQGTLAYGYNAWGSVVFAEPQLGLGGHITDPEANQWERSWNQAEVRVDQVKRPAEMIEVTDSDSDCLESSPGYWDELSNPVDYPGEPWRRTWPGNRHYGNSNVLFVDAHVEPMLQSALIKPEGRIRRKWNNDYHAHSELWPDLPPGYNSSGD